MSRWTEPGYPASRGIGTGIRGLLFFSWFDKRHSIAWTTFPLHPWRTISSTLLQWPGNALVSNPIGSGCIFRLTGPWLVGLSVCRATFEGVSLSSDSSGWASPLNFLFGDLGVSGVGMLFSGLSSESSISCSGSVLIRTPSGRAIVSYLSASLPFSSMSLSDSTGELWYDRSPSSARVKNGSLFIEA